MAAIYVNDFNLFGRTWQVNIQAEAADRSDLVGDLADLCAQHDGRDGAAALDRQRPRRARPAGDQPLQQLPLR